MRVHGEIRLVPLAENAETLEFALVRFDETGGELAAHAAKFGGGNFAGFAAELFFDFRLDGQAVAIPTGNVRRTKTGHGFRLDDQVF